MNTRVAVTAGVERTTLRVWNRQRKPPCPSNRRPFATPVCAGVPRNITLTSGVLEAAFCACATPAKPKRPATARRRTREDIGIPFGLRSANDVPRAGLRQRTYGESRDRAVKRILRTVTRTLLPSASDSYVTVSTMVTVCDELLAFGAATVTVKTYFPAASAGAVAVLTVSVRTPVD